MAGSAQRIERRLAAIFAADVAGYSRLMSQDEVATLRTLTTHREIMDGLIAEHGGRIANTAGDSVLAEFPSAVDAVQCAFEVHKALADLNTGADPEGALRFRIGIHVGDVMVQGRDLLGDGVNIAARVQALAEPGGVWISGRAHDEVEGKLPHLFEEKGEQEVKGIARPIRVYALEDVGSTGKPKQVKALPLPDKPSIAVLPFANMSGDPEQEYFADGIVEDITTGLSRIKWLFVIARNSSFAFKSKTVDVRQVGRELGVRYVLEGGVRKIGNRVRITAQLVEAPTGSHLWADRFDGALEDVFDLQDQITDKVVAIVEPRIQRSEIERSRRKRPESLDAYDLFLRAVPYTASQTAEDGKIAIPYLEDALRIEPDYAAAHALLAWCYEWCYSRAGFHEADKQAALSHAHAALTGSTDDATALSIAGFVITMLSQDHEAGLNASERALALNPSCATALYLGAITNAFSGHPAAATAQASRALRLSPFDLLVYLAHLAQGVAAVQEGRYEEAGNFMARMVQANSSLSSLYFFGAATLALSGRLEAARSWAEQGFEKEPGFRPRLFSELMAPQVADKLKEGWHLLCLPGQSH
jgi:TolB-like protein/Flp pilus assembly protein TadD